MWRKVEVVLLPNPQLIIIIIQTFLTDPNNPCCFLQIHFFPTVCAGCVQFPPLFDKLNDFPYGPLFAPLFFVFWGTLALALLEKGWYLFGVANHDDGQLKIASGNHERRVRNLLERDIEIFFRVVEFKGVLGRVFDIFSNEGEVHEWRIGEKNVRKNNGLVGFFLL